MIIYTQIYDHMFVGHMTLLYECHISSYKVHPCDATGPTWDQDTNQISTLVVLDRPNA